VEQPLEGLEGPTFILEPDALQQELKPASSDDDGD
jgi:hypothetical protein